MLLFGTDTALSVCVGFELCPRDVAVSTSGSASPWRKVSLASLLAGDAFPMCTRRRVSGILAILGSATLGAVGSESAHLTFVLLA